VPKAEARQRDIYEIRILNLPHSTTRATTMLLTLLIIIRIIIMLMLMLVPMLGFSDWFRSGSRC
jgi:hypothetical protein